MPETYKRTSPGGIIILFLALITAIALKSGYTEDRNWYAVMFVTLPLMILTVVDVLKKKYPVEKSLRQYFIELIQSRKRKYFSEPDLDKKVFNGRRRSISYQSKKTDNETVASRMEPEANRSGSRRTKIQSHPN